mgnify:CR=1 FL=1
MPTTKLTQSVKILVKNQNFFIKGVFLVYKTKLTKMVLKNAF